MKKLLASLIIFSFLTLSLYSEEKPKKGATPATPAIPATPATPATPAKEKPKKEGRKIYKVEGIIDSVSTTDSSITIKKEDNTTITLKATTPKTKQSISKLTTGDKIKALYREKEGENVLLRIIKPGKGKEKKK